MDKPTVTYQGFKKTNVEGEVIGAQGHATKTKGEKRTVSLCKRG